MGCSSTHLDLSAEILIKIRSVKFNDMSKITIIDYGMGNIGSIQNMLKKIGADSIVTSYTGEIKNSLKLILPGVGSFDTGIKNLIKLDLVDILNHKVINEKTPIIGFCLGMQLMTRSSEEGKLRGFGWMDAKTCRFRFNNSDEYKIPHMGWNSIKIMKDNPLLMEQSDRTRFYFVHSYHVICKQSKDILFMTNYGYDFVSGFMKNNIVGLQFHPEKSHKYGMQILKNFVWNI